MAQEGVNLRDHGRREIPCSGEIVRQVEIERLPTWTNFTTELSRASSRIAGAAGLNVYQPPRPGLVLSYRRLAVALIHFRHRGGAARTNKFLLSEA